MSKILDTVVSYEEQLVDYVKKARKPVTDYVAKGVKLVETRLPEVTYPKSIATPIEVVESQAAFAKKLVDANTALVTSVLSTVAPIAGYAASTKKATRSTKAA
ncbi:MAG TPA: hypothetical protein VIR58_06800 [Acidimicrobiales bacterium]